MTALVQRTQLCATETSVNAGWRRLHPCMTHHVTIGASFGLGLLALGLKSAQLLPAAPIGTAWMCVVTRCSPPNRTLRHRDTITRTSHRLAHI